MMDSLTFPRVPPASFHLSSDTSQDLPDGMPQNIVETLLTLVIA